MSTSTYAGTVAVIGGGLGGVAAALAALSHDESVVLTEETDWLGGQATSQGVSALDENQYVETTGRTATYGEFRDRIRQEYRERYDVSDVADGPPNEPGDWWRDRMGPVHPTTAELQPDDLNPGNCWVSRLAFEPEIAVDVVDAMLEERAAQSGGDLTVLREHEPTDATVEDGRVTRVTLEDNAGGKVYVEAEYVLDATELGDLLPLTDTAYVTGAEARSDTAEPSAKKGEAKPREDQSFTFPFAMEYRPGEDHTIEKPEGYERFHDEQPYTLDITSGIYRMFEVGPGGELPFWTYRRLVDADQFADRERDVTMINWAGNDYYGPSIIDRPEAEREEILDEARRLARGFLYWLQTEAPRDDGGNGYPGFKLLPSVMGTDHGLSKFPYIRESRRIKPIERVFEQDVAAYATSGARASHFADTVGIGHYAIDLHRCAENPDVYEFAETSPFQIPFRTMVPRDGPSNLLPACKNIGTTHLTNGCYRLHPIEWNIGESAGVAASYCLANDVAPADIEGHHLRRYQYRLVDRGIPLLWTSDVKPTDDSFVPTQFLTTERGFLPDSPRHHRLDVRPDEPLVGADLLSAAQSLATILDADASVTVSTSLSDPVSKDAVRETLSSLGVDGTELNDPPTWRDLCDATADAIETSLP